MQLQRLTAIVEFAEEVAEIDADDMKAERDRETYGKGLWMEGIVGCAHRKAFGFYDAAWKDGPAKQHHELKTLGIHARAGLPVPFALLCISRALFCCTHRLACLIMMY